MIIEVIDPAFEFYQHGKPTGHYARGLVIKGSKEDFRVELLCNGLKIWVSKSICKTISTGREYGKDVLIPYRIIKQTVI